MLFLFYKAERVYQAIFKICLTVLVRPEMLQIRPKARSNKETNCSYGLTEMVPNTASNFFSYSYFEILKRLK
jgi:hypothetical protein